MSSTYTSKSSSIDFDTGTSIPSSKNSGTKNDEVNREFGHYVVTAHRSTAVHDAVRCCFTSASDTNLLTTTSTHLHLHTLQNSTSTLRLINSFPLRGRSLLCPLNPPQKNCSAPSSLFILHPFSWSTVSWREGEAVTTRWGRTMEGEEPEMGRCIACCEECVAIYSTDGWVRILPRDGEGNIVSSPEDTIGNGSGKGGTGKGRMGGGGGGSAGSVFPAFDIRLEEERERTLLDMCFLDGQSPPMLVLLHRDSSHRIHLSSRLLDLRSGCVTSSGPLDSHDIDGSSGIVVSCPGNGVLVIGHRHISFVTGNIIKRIPMEETAITAIARLSAADNDADSCEPSDRFLLSDERGRLMLLFLRIETKGIVRGMQLDYLGKVSVPNALAYLDAGHVYVGSVYGDSQLIQLKSTDENEEVAHERGDDCNNGCCSEEENEYHKDAGLVRVVEEYVGLGPIVDFCLVDLDGRGQCQAVTCSGVGREGSIRIVRNGIGIQIEADVEIPGIKSLFSLRDSYASPHDRYLLQSFIGQTRLLGITSEDEMEEAFIPGFDTASETLMAKNVWPGNVLVQVTDRGVFTASCASLEHVDEWICGSEGKITVGGCNDGGQVVVAARGGALTFLQVDLQGKLEVVDQIVLDQEVSCINLDPWKTFTAEETMNGDAMEVDHDPSKNLSKFVSVGLWNINSVRILSLASHLREVLRIDLGGDTQARSILMVTLGNACMLLVGLGNGELISYVVHNGNCNNQNHEQQLTVSTRKRVAIGTRSLSLSPFRSSRDGTTCVFLSCDQPTVAYPSGGKLLYSGVNLPHYSMIHVAVPFRAPPFPDGLALASESTLIIGIVDDIQKLHITTRRLGMSPRKIAHHTEGSIFAVGCVTNDDYVRDYEMNNVILFLDDSTFEEIQRINLEPYELITSMLACNLCNTNSCFQEQSHSSSSLFNAFSSVLLVGTAFAYPDEDEPKAGRILAYRPAAHGAMGTSSRITMELLCEAPTRGGVYSMAPFHQGSILATINSKTKLYRLCGGEDLPELRSECSHDGNILSLTVKNCDSDGSTAIVGDLMRSISVLKYCASSKSIEEVARDHTLNWTTAIEILNNKDGVYIGAENYQNLFVLKRDTSNSISEEARSRLSTQGEYHLGEMVNKFLRGSLIMASQHQASSSLDIDNRGDLVMGSSLLFVTADGMIGSIFGLSAQDFAFFRALGQAVSLSVPALGNLSHDEYRAYSSERGVSRPCRGFIDGDLVESFLDLKKKDMEDVVVFMNSEGNWWTEGGDEKKEQVLTVEDVLAKVEEISRLH